MKSVVALTLLVLALAFPVSAYAACPNITGPYMLSWYYWYEYEWDRSCAGTSGSVSTTTLSCFNDPGHQFTGTGTVTYSYTLTASDPIVDPTKWQVTQFVDFNDPINSNTNTLNLSVSVTSGGSTTSYPFLTWHGGLGDKSCTRESYYYFTADVGDTITVTATATNFNNPGTVIKVGVPILFSGN